MDKTKIAVAVFDKCAQLYAEKYMDVGLYKQSLDLLCGLLPPHAEILELACGPGNITSYLLKMRPDLKILATDLAPKMIEIAAAQCHAEFQIMDCRAVATLNRKFDAIICGFGLPYLNKEEAIELISNAEAALNQDGILYLSTMEDDYGKSGFEKGSTGDEIYLHYHEAAYLIKALEENQLEVVAIERKKTEVNNKAFTDLILVSKKRS